jgi:monofunctional chorismate mutase
MNLLDQIRKDIDRIDDEMKALFLKRMELVSYVKAYKKEHHLPIVDLDREQSMLSKQLENMEDETLKGLYESFLKHIMSLSKAYQQ